jgi:hypothetical protein
MMRTVKGLTVIAWLLEAAGLEMAALVCVAPLETPRMWTRTMAWQARAAARGEFVCVYDLLPLLHRPAVHAFLTSWAALWWAAGLFAAGIALLAAAAGLAERLNLGPEAALSERTLMATMMACASALGVLLML